MENKSNAVCFSLYEQTRSDCMSSELHKTKHYYLNAALSLFFVFYPILISTQVKSKDSKNCTKEMVIEYHNKTIYDCKNVTKRHCTTLWTANDSGEKLNLKLFLFPVILVLFQVWSGNEDDCRDVTWEECNPIEKKVKPI